MYEGLLDHDAIRVSEVHLGFDGKSGAESEIPLAEVERIAATGRAQLVAFLAEKLDRSEKAIEKGLVRGDKLSNGEEPETRRLVMTACESDESLVRRTLPYAPLLRDDLQGLPTVYAAGGIIVTKTRARRDSGTEYTPRVLAEEIVRYALEPLVYSPGPVDGARRETWLVKPSADLLALKICDPACGSGAFLVAACRYLAERVSEAWQREGHIADDDPIRDAQRIISERCLYGVDRDPMAVEMAKLSLWLLTFARQRPFGFLDHALREGDSLLGITSLDQLRALHFDPERGRALHDGALFDVLRPLGALVDQAVRYRLQLESHVTLDIGDAQEKSRLNLLARECVESARLIADALTAVAVMTAGSGDRETDAAFAALGDSIRVALSETGGSGRVSRLDATTNSVRRRLDHEKPPGAPTRRPLHWSLEFPEVFARARGGFDLVAGNPPFLGGKFISGRFGTDYRSFLVKWLAAERRGHADLVAYFFLRGAEIARRLAFIATNTIGQGDTREVALDALLEANWTIGRAEKSRVWPGVAAIQVAEVWCHSDLTIESAILGGRMVAGISALLVPNSRAAGQPFRLRSNMNVAFIGSFAYGSGFTLEPPDAQRLKTLDPRNEAVIFPYMNGDDLCSRPDVTPSRFIIDFGTRTEEESKAFPECYEHIRISVKPMRDKASMAVRACPWWLHWRTRPELRRSIANLQFVVAIPLVSKFSIPVGVLGQCIFSHALGIFASDSHALYGVLSSSTHHAWSRAHGSTLETRSRYTPTDCFETFALPSGENNAIGTTMRRLHQHRAELMLVSDHGLTATYNRVHSRENWDADVLLLRDLHTELDCNVLAAYGWSDIDLDHDFRVTEEGLRFTISEPARIEILDRLLELNHSRHAEEVAQGLEPSVKGKRVAKGRAKPSSAEERVQELLEL